MAAQELVTLYRVIIWLPSIVSPVLAVVFESLFVFCYDRRARNELMTTHKLGVQLDIYRSKEGLTKIVTDLRNLFGSRIESSFSVQQYYSKSRKDLRLS